MGGEQGTTLRAGGGGFGRAAGQACGLGHLRAVYRVAEAAGQGRVRGVQPGGQDRGRGRLFPGGGQRGGDQAGVEVEEGGDDRLGADGPQGGGPRGEVAGAPGDAQCRVPLVGLGHEIDHAVQRLGQSPGLAYEDRIDRGRLLSLWFGRTRHGATLPSRSYRWVASHVTGVAVTPDRPRSRTRPPCRRSSGAGGPAGGGRAGHARRSRGRCICSRHGRRRTR